MSFLFSSGVINPIPDSVTNYWPTNTGSGSTLVDNVGSLDMTISGATWVTGSGGKGNAYLSYDGTDDISYNLDGSSAWGDHNNSWALWFYPDSGASGCIYGAGDTQGGFNHYIGLNGFSQTPAGELSFFVDDADAGSNIEISTPNYVEETWNFAAFIKDYDGAGQAEFFHAVQSDTDITSVGTQNCSNKDQDPTRASLGAMRQEGGIEQGYISADIDDTYAVRNGVMTRAEIESIFNSTKSNYS